MIKEERVLALFTQLDPNGFLARYLRYAGTQTDAPLSYHVGVGLSLIAAVAPEHLRVEFGAQSQLTNIWVCLVGASRAARKTASIGLGTKLLRLVAPDRLRTRPGSVEGLEEDMEVQGTRVIVYPEFGEFLSRSSSKGQHMAALREKFTELHDGDSQTKTLSKRSVEIPNPRLSILAGVTPTYIDEYTSRLDWMGGFFGRFIILYAQRERTYPLAPPEDPKRKEDALESLEDLLHKTVGPCVGLTPEARVAYLEWHRSLQGRVEKMDSNEAAKATIEAVPNFALRIALLLGFDRPEIRQDAWVIPTATLKAAILTAEMHFDSALWVLDRLGGSVWGRHRREVLEALGDQPRTLPGLLRRLPHFSKSYIVKHLETLVSAEIVYQLTLASGIEVFSTSPIAGEFGEVVGGPVGGNVISLKKNKEG